MKLNSFITKLFLKRKQIKQKNIFINSKSTLSSERVKFDIFYPSSFQQNNKLDLFLPKEKNGILIVNLHGDFFTGGDKIDSLKECINLSDAGYYVASLNFSKFNENGFQNSLLDICSAINFLIENKDNLGLDFSEIYIKSNDSSCFLAIALGLSFIKDTNFYNLVNKEETNQLISSYIFVDSVFDFRDYVLHMEESFSKKALEFLFSKKIDDKDFINSNCFEQFLLKNNITKLIKIFYNNNSHYYKFLEKLKNVFIESGQMIKLKNISNLNDISKDLLEE